jgi:ribonuclease J
VDIAAAAGRKIGFVGRSMVDNVEIAHGMNRLRIPDGMVVRSQGHRFLPAEKLVVLVSGSQAEPMSSLSRVAVDNHRC